MLAFDDSQILLLFCAFGGSFLLTFLLVFNSFRSSLALNYNLFRWVLVGVLCCLAVDGMDYLHSQVAGRALTWTRFLGMASMALLCWSVVGSPSRIPNLLNNRRPAVRVPLLVATLALCVWSIARILLRSVNYSVFGAGMIMPGTVVVERSNFGTTDKGNHIELYHFDADNSMAEYITHTDERYLGFRTSIIQRDEVDISANCHGWVFTGGRFLLKGEGVQQILDDNGYEVVEKPTAGDIVIYRNALGSILHTGLVQGVLKDETILVESKWGIDQRFLHLPEQQPYSSIFEFYRSNRGGHLIEIRPRAALSSVEGG